ncbi:hypothetical protein Hanom_Chr07g00622211 [Helianthus anomalus]
MYVSVSGWVIPYPYLTHEIYFINNPVPNPSSNTRYLKFTLSNYGFVLGWRRHPISLGILHMSPIGGKITEKQWSMHYTKDPVQSNVIID